MDMELFEADKADKLLTYLENELFEDCPHSEARATITCMAVVSALLQDEALCHKMVAAVYKMANEYHEQYGLKH
ncbi:MAG: hypothetical protein DSZ04_02995 [Sulfurimonas sp.]|nr:MAG: hypothetical protein DSZ04_02995 [Sulfurimonas sp.]